MPDHASPDPPTSRPAVAAAALAMTLGIGAAAWMVTLRQVRSMDTGDTASLGPFASFVGAWAVMMAAMMLPAAAPAVLRLARARGRVLVVLRFLGSYLAVWTFIGVVIFALYRPPESTLAGLLLIAAGIYELTPVKGEYRRRCRETVGSGWRFGLDCAGSSIGLMLVLLALGIMSLAWMIVVTVLVLVQKVLPARRAIDVPLALGLVALGLVILIAPSSIGLVASMPAMPHR